MYVPGANGTNSQMGNNMYTGLEANHLVNFYNSNLLDDMFNKNQNKFMSKSYGTNNQAVNAHLRKNAQSALANPSQPPISLNQNSLLKQ